MLANKQFALMLEKVDVRNFKSFIFNSGHKEGKEILLVQKKKKGDWQIPRHYFWQSRWMLLRCLVNLFNGGR